MAQHNATGKQAETMAAVYLQKQGLTLLNKNYRCRRGEIDLIMLHRDTLVFVEVRKRNRQDYGSGIETINTAKKKCILRTATHYLVTHNLYERVPYRFDVISLDKYNHIEWVQGAF